MNISVVRIIDPLSVGAARFSMRRAAQDPWADGVIVGGAALGTQWRKHRRRAPHLLYSGHETGGEVIAFNRVQRLRASCSTSGPGFSSYIDASQVIASVMSWTSQSTRSDWVITGINICSNWIKSHFAAMYMVRSLLITMWMCPSFVGIQLPAFLATHLDPPRLLYR